MPHLGEISIALVEAQATADGTAFGRRVRDIYSGLTLPSRAIDLLAAILKREGFSQVKCFNPNLTKKKRFDREDLLEIASADIIGLSVITRTAEPSYDLARKVRLANPNAIIVVGGPHSTAMPEEALRWCDLVAFHEGDRSIVDIARELRDRRSAPDWSSIGGLAYKGEDGAMIETAPRAFLTGQELSQLPFPEYDEGTRRRITHSVITTSRGCPFKCDYCSVIENFGSAFRFMDVPSSIELIRHVIQTQAPKKPVFFGDDIFHGKKSRTKELLERIIREDLKFTWGAQVRVESARDEELLGLMHRAGCERVYIGFESIDDETLALYNKRAVRADSDYAIQRYHAHRISIHGMFVLGSDVDTVETVRRTSQYARKMRLDTAQFFSLTTMPGPPLTQRYSEEGKILSTDWRRYDAQHVVVAPGKITPYQLQRALHRANIAFYSYTEAVRHFFIGQEHIYNALVRVYGRFLTLSVSRSSKEYIQSLRTLHRWQRRTEKSAEKLSERLQELTKDIEAGLADYEERLAELKRDAALLWADSLQRMDRLAEEFSGYAAGVHGRIKAELDLLFDGLTEPAAG